MKGQMMSYPLTTTAILEYGNRIFTHKEIHSLLPDSTWHSYSFGEMYNRSKRLARALTEKLGLKAGDRIATLAWNQYQHLELYFAIPGMGGICHPLNIRLSIPQIVYIINHAEDKAIFADITLLPLLEKIVPEISASTKFVIMNAPSGFHTNFVDYILYEDLISGIDDQYSWYPSEENDACALSYTSGTTGNPKGVLYSHRSTYLHALGIMQPNAFNISANDTALLIVPQFHVMAWGFPFVCLLAGANMIMPGCHLQPDALVDMIQLKKVNKANGVPAIWMGIYESMKKKQVDDDFPLKEFFVGGSAVPEILLDNFDKHFGISGIHAWGMTETSPLGTISRLNSNHQSLNEKEKLHLRSKQGIEIPGVEIRIIDDRGNEAPRDGETVGEIQVRGAWVLNSYYKSEMDNDECFDHGWFKTGDVGTVDDMGYMLITDRKKDLIKSGGEWISSIALELALLKHPYITDACVIAIPDKKWTERPIACIVTRDERELAHNDLRAFLSTQFAHYQLPDRFIRMIEIPKTSVGKLDKKELRKRYAEGILE